ncbi:MAG TPA: thiamine phosphate synthase [Candidatus Sulfotelmatobacter sp.]|nr:thiamine phosphate synthase [Candidatus Sulfotelmatobacter sp.]
MPAECILYYITDRIAFPGDQASRRRRLLEKIREAARAGVDYIQLREKDLSPRELESLAWDAMGAIRESPNRTALLINSRTDVALAVGAGGVHLRSNDILPEDIRTIWKESRTAVCGAATPARQNSPRDPVIGVSCHSPQEVVEAAAAASFAVFAPVFEKKDAVASGLGLLREACRANIPVLALGGITLANARSCLAAGAAGIAAIRLFQDNDIATVVKQLRG